MRGNHSYGAPTTHTGACAQQFSSNSKRTSWVPSSVLGAYLLVSFNPYSSALLGTIAFLM